MICYKLGLASRHARSGGCPKYVRDTIKKEGKHAGTDRQCCAVREQSGTTHALRSELHSAPQLAHLVLQFYDTVHIESVDRLEVSCDPLSYLWLLHGERHQALTNLYGCTLSSSDSSLNYIFCASFLVQSPSTMPTSSAWVN